MVLECSPSSRQLVKVMVSWLARCQFKAAILFGCQGITCKSEICEAPAVKEDHMKLQQGQKTL